MRGNIKRIAKIICNFIRAVLSDNIVCIDCNGGCIFNSGSSFDGCINRFSLLGSRGGLNCRRNGAVGVGIELIASYFNSVNKSTIFSTSPLAIFKSAEPFLIFSLA